ncbi:MAG: oligopeptide transport system permease protein [Crocinitomicaceae bacterium]|jgi:oligopeptide transport system permease protein
MFRLIISRVLQAFAVVFFLFTLTFIAIRAIPGDPLSTDDKSMPEHVKEKIEEYYGLDKPLIVQYGRYVKNVLQGDLGLSTSKPGRTVNEIIVQSLPASLLVGLGGITVAVLLGIPMGILAALKKNSWIDYSSMAVAMVGICIPTFVLGPLLQLWVASKTDWINVAGWDTAADILLPSITLGVGSAAYLARLTRGGMLEVLSQDYIRTAKAKGVPMLPIIVKHTLRGAMMPAVTYLGPAFAAIITGSFIVETIFQVPGMGQHFINAVTSKDYALLQGLVIFYGFLMAGANLLVDIALLLLNPRLRDAT